MLLNEYSVSFQFQEKENPFLNTDWKRCSCFFLYNGQFVSVMKDSFHSNAKNRKAKRVLRIDLFYTWQQNGYQDGNLIC